MNPNDRFASAADLKDALSAVQNGSPLPFGSPLSAGSRPRSLLPPGFRSRRPIRMIFAAAGYSILLYFSLSLKLKNIEGARLLLNRALFTAAMLSIVFFSGDFLSVQRRLPLCRNRNTAVRLAGILLFDLIIFAFYIVLLVLLEQWIYAT